MELEGQGRAFRRFPIDPGCFSPERDELIEDLGKLPLNFKESFAGLILPGRAWLAGGGCRRIFPGHFSVSCWIQLREFPDISTLLLAGWHVNVQVCGCWCAPAP